MGDSKFRKGGLNVSSESMEQDGKKTPENLKSQEKEREDISIIIRKRFKNLWKGLISFWIGDYPRAVNKDFQKKFRLVYKQSKLGILWNLYQHAITFASCFYFIESDNSQQLDSHLSVTLSSFEVVFFISIVLDLIMRYIKAENRIKFWIKWSVIIDIVAIIPILVVLGLMIRSVFDDNADNLHYAGVLRFLRIFKIVRLFRALSLTKIAQSTLYRQASVIFLSIFIIIYIGANTMVLVEGLDFSTACYFMVVTITTVGYGDYSPKTGLGQVIVCILIATTFAWIPSEISTLIEDVRLVRKYKVRYKPKAGRNHILIIGNITAAKVNAFASEFFHPDKSELTNINPVLLSNLSNKRKYIKQMKWVNHLPTWLRKFTKNVTYHLELRRSRWAIREKNKPYDVILMDSKEPSDGLIELLENPLLERRLIYIEGSALDEDDLERVSAKYATACFIFTTQSQFDTEDEDSTIVLRTLLLKSFQKDIPAVVQLHHSHNRSQLHLVRPQHIICIEEIFMSLLGVSALYPGLCITLTNMITSSTDKNSSCDILIGSDYFKRPNSRSRGTNLHLRSAGLYGKNDKVEVALTEGSKQGRTRVTQSGRNITAAPKNARNAKPRMSIGFSTAWAAENEKDSEESYYDEDDPNMDWLWDYLDSTGMEMYTVRAAKAFQDLSFTEACEEVYKALDGDVILLGVEEHERNDDGIEHVVSSFLNPGKDYIFYEGTDYGLEKENPSDDPNSSYSSYLKEPSCSTWVVVIAISQTVANLVESLQIHKTKNQDRESNTVLKGPGTLTSYISTKLFNADETTNDKKNTKNDKAIELVEIGDHNSTLNSNKKNEFSYIDTYGKKKVFQPPPSIKNIFQFASDQNSPSDLSKGNTQNNAIDILKMNQNVEQKATQKTYVCSVTWTDIDSTEDILFPPLSPTSRSSSPSSTSNSFPTTPTPTNLSTTPQIERSLSRISQNSAGSLSQENDPNTDFIITKNVSSKPIKNHTIILLPSKVKAIHYLLRPFLASYIRGTCKSRDIVILTPDKLGKKTREEALMQPNSLHSLDSEDDFVTGTHQDKNVEFPRIFVVRGNPHELEDMERAGIYECSSCIVVATYSGVTSIDDDYVDEHTIKTFLNLEKALQDPRSNNFTYCIEILSLSTLNILDETKRTFQAVSLLSKITDNAQINDEDDNNFNNFLNHGGGPNSASKDRSSLLYRLGKQRGEDSISFDNPLALADDNHSPKDDNSRGSMTAKWGDAVRRVSTLNNVFRKAKADERDDEVFSPRDLTTKADLSPSLNSNKYQLFKNSIFQSTKANSIKNINMQDKKNRIQFGSHNLGKVLPIKVAGLGLPVFLLDTLSVQIFHNPMLLRFLRLFLFLDEHVASKASQNSNSNDNSVGDDVNKRQIKCGRVAQIALPIHLEGDTFASLYTWILKEYELIAISIFRTTTYTKYSGTSSEMKATTQYPITLPVPGLILEKSDLIFVVGPQAKLSQILKDYGKI